MNKLVKLNCWICQKEYEGEEPEMCCSGRECGCMGQPIDPIVCSEECYNKLVNGEHNSHTESVTVP